MKMTLVKRTSDALAREAASRAGDQAKRLSDINERFDRLVRTGAVQPERYNIAPINPISMAAPPIVDLD
jgi:hypothetical protein